jgi:hypothetical protein
MRVWGTCLVITGLALAGCGPMPVEQAEAQCLEMLRPISGEAKLGVNQDGKAIYDIDMTLQMTTAMRGDPAARYDRCVFNKSGRMPTRPLYSRTDWKG